LIFADIFSIPIKEIASLGTYSKGIEDSIRSPYTSLTRKIDELLSSPPSPFGPFRIEVTDLSCVRGFNTLFEGLTFNVNSGSALHVVGANGSGKTSLLRILCGLSLAESGQIQCNGSDIKNIASEYRGQLCYLGHKPALKPDLTPCENLVSLAAIRNEGAADPRSATEGFLTQLEVDHTMNRPCRQLSAGQKQRIAIARVVMSRAPIWFLDEPGTSLDSNGIKLLAVLMRRQLENNGLIIFTSHQGFDLPFERLERISLDS